MDLTPELKAEIDSRSYAELLAKWRFAPLGDPLFQGESGKYYAERISDLKKANPEEAVAASKTIGW